MPQGLVTKNFIKLDASFSKGYTTASLQGSSRSSKTYSIVQWLINRCYNIPDTTVSVVRKTMPALKRSVYRDFKEIMIDWGLWNDRQMNKSEFVYTFGNGSWVEFFSCEDEQKLRGSKRKILFVNEANEISFLEWQQLQMRTTLFSIIDYNPSFSEEHWINQVNSERKTSFWISTYKDNLFLEQKVIDEIESLQWKNKSLWQVYGLGMRAIVEGLVFPNIEIVDYIPREAERHRYVGMDFGYASDPTAIVEVAFWKKRIYINELCYQTHMLTSDIIRELKEIDWYPEIISESADPRMVDEIYNAGLDIKAVHKYPGSINAGLMKMKEYQICVTRHSVNVVKEFHNYTYRQDKEGKWLNEPIDAFNHCFVGETLVATEFGDHRIDELKVGMKAKTSYGFHKIAKIFNQGVREVWKVRLQFINFALEVEATPDHKFKTKEGWKKLEELKTSDVLYLDRCLMGKYIISTKESVTIQEAQTDYIGSCGNTITGKSQKGIMSTTKTETPKTILSKILNWCKRMNIFTCTPKNICNQMNTWRRLASKWHALLNTPKNGIIQKKAESGTDNTADRLPKTSNQLSSCANSAENISLQNQRGITDFVPITVRQNGEETTTSTMKCESANYVERSLRSTNTIETDFAVEAVLCDITVLNVSKRQVYDIEVENAHEFFANGILVHNCIDATRYVILEKILGGYGKGASASEILGFVG